MASPDLRPYLGDVLLLPDLNPQQVAELAIAELATRLPGWVPLEASTEVALIEALAVEVSELVYAVNRVPGAVLEALLALLGAARDPGRAPVAFVAMTPNDPDNAVTIPAGTRFRLPLEPGVEPMDFTLDAEEVIDAGEVNHVGAITGTRNSPEANGPDHYGDALGILDPVPLTSAVLVGAVANGRAPELGPDYLERASRILGRLTDTLVMPEHFTARALELIDLGVYRATTVNLWDADDETFATGHVTVVVAGPAGGDLFDNFAAIAADLQARCLASLVVHVVGPVITTVDVHAVVTVADGYDPDDVTADVMAALTAYLDPDTWPWAFTVRRNRLLAIAIGVEGVDAVELLDEPDGDPFEDLELIGPGPLAKAGTVTAAEA